MSVVFQTCYHWFEAKHSSILSESMYAIAGWVPVSTEAQEAIGRMERLDQNTAGPPNGVEVEDAIIVKAFRAKPSQTQARHRQDLALVGVPAQARYMAQHSRGWTQIEVWGSTAHQETGRRCRLNHEIRSSVLEPEEASEFTTLG